MDEGLRQPTNPQPTSTFTQLYNTGPINLVADETVYKEWEDRMERAATTASSLDAEQDSGNINRTQSMATLNESFPQGTDSGSGPRGYTLGSGEDSMKLLELMELCTKLSDLVSKKKREMLLLTTSRHNLVLPVQVNAAEGVSINTSIQGTRLRKTYGHTRETLWNNRSGVESRLVSLQVVLLWARSVVGAILCGVDNGFCQKALGIRVFPPIYTFCGNTDFSQFVLGHNKIVETNLWKT
ncbi:hypothetical protein Tco_0723605 [Tanacetum coccineum]